jgi:radical SAM enzyme (TIGR01210 family)
MNNLEELLGKPQNTGLEGNLRTSHYYKIISEFQRNIHSKIPEGNYNTNKVAAPVDIREELFNGINYKRAVMYLMSNGCEWALKSAHGCTMCGHLAKQTRKNNTISVNDYLQQFKEEFEKIDFKNYPLLNLYNNGSFLNDNEIPSEARRGMLKNINENQDIKMLVLETRPEFVTEEKVLEIMELVPNKHVELAIGLELKDDFYRTICINKGFSLRQFDSAVNIITKYLNFRTYVLLKPPFLTEKESIEQAIETIEYAFSRGGTTVSLEACTVQDYTLVKYLYERKMYSTPWLWSIIEVVKRVKTPKKLIIGLFQFYPSPNTVPYNCDQCSEMVMEAIRQYNRTLNKKIFDKLTCECKKKWQEIIKEKPLPFGKRLELLNSEINASSRS